NDTFTLLVDTTQTLDFSRLQWTFQTSGGPIADPGPNQTASVGSTVTLNGAGSINPTGIGTLSYTWSFVSLPPRSNAFIARSSAWTFVSRPAGSAAALAGANTVSPRFTVDIAGTYVVQLIVNDGQASAPSTVTITASAGASRPTANAGPNQSVAVGAAVQL